MKGHPRLVKEAEKEAKVAEEEAEEGCHRPVKEAEKEATVAEEEAEGPVARLL